MNHGKHVKLIRHLIKENKLVIKCFMKKVDLIIVNKIFVAHVVVIILKKLNLLKSMSAKKFAKKMNRPELKNFHGKDVLKQYSLNNQVQIIVILHILMIMIEMFVR
jgi:hypothetical protein